MFVYFLLWLWNYYYNNMNPCNQKFLKTETFGDSFCMLHSCSLNVCYFFSLMKFIYQCFSRVLVFFYFGVILTSLLIAFQIRIKIAEVWNLAITIIPDYRWSPIVCVALDYQIISIFPIVYGDFVGEDYSLIYNFSLTYDYVGINSVPVGTTQMSTLMPNSATFYFHTVCEDW